MRKGLVSLAVGLVVAMHLPNPAMATTATSTSVTTLCEHGEHRIVHNGTGGPAYQVRNAYFRGVRKMCITNRRLQTNFVLTRPPGRDPRGKVVAYPDIFRGCLWHVCSPNAGL